MTITLNSEAGVVTNLEVGSSATTEPHSHWPHAGRSRSWIVFNAIYKNLPVILIHAGCVAIYFTGTNWLDWILFPGIMLLRGLVTTVGYHRYFAHRSFKTSRPFQFVLGSLCCCNLQQGPLWWAAVHRHHHRHSDDPHDTHSPVTGNFFWAYFGWMFFTLEEPNWHRVKDLTRFPELRLLERFRLVPPALMLAGLFLLGGWSMVCVCFCLTATLALHSACIVNTIGHLIGTRRYPTPDQSRNSFVLGLLALGDGWHHNHHHYPHSANHGFFWWEIDTSYRVIQLLGLVGLVWDIRRVPSHKLMPPQQSAA